MGKKNKGKLSKWPRRASRAWTFGIFAVGIVSLVFLGGYLVRSERSKVDEGAASVVSSSGGAEADLRRMEASDALFSQTRHTKGDPAAPVTIIEFSDFQ